MTGKDLQKAMSDINDDFILEASPDQIRTKQPVPIWRRNSFRVISGLAAACFILVIGIGTYQVRQSSTGKADADLGSVSGESAEKAQSDISGQANEVSPNTGANEPRELQDLRNEAGEAQPLQEPAASQPNMELEAEEAAAVGVEYDRADQARPSKAEPASEAVTEAISEEESESETPDK